MKNDNLQLEGLVIFEQFEILKTQSDGNVTAMCNSCGTTMTMHLEPIDLDASHVSYPCGCSVPLHKTDRECVQIAAESAIRILGRAPNMGRHRAVLCQCYCGSRFIKRAEEIRRKAVTSCGCRRRAQQSENLSHAGQNTIVMGTNIANITQNNAQQNSQSGVRGVYYDPIRKKWVAQTYFQRHRYICRCDTFVDAIEARTFQLRIRNEFLIWWANLSEAEQDIAITAYQGEQNTEWRILKKRLDADFRQLKQEDKDID